MVTMTSTRFAAANLLKAGGGGWLQMQSLPSCVPRLLVSLGYQPGRLKVGTFSSTSTSIGAGASARIGRSAFCTSTNTNTNTNTNTDTDVAASSSSWEIKDAADLLDIRVGRILRAWRHEEADTLYVEEVDVGEPEPRIICSGLVNYIPLEHLQDIKVVVLANLKPRNMRGVKSSGMLMAASDASHDNVELLLPPHDSIPGERIWFGSQQNQSPPATPNQIQKKKIWELVQPHLKTDDSCIAMLGEYEMRTSAGVVLCTSLKNARIS